MTEVAGALAPVFLLIVVGWAARARRLASAEAFGLVNRFGYFMLYPAVLFTLSSRAEFNVAAGPLVIGVLAGFMVIMLLALALRLVFRSDGPAYSSVFQGSVRWNGFVLLAAAAPLYGPEGPHLIGLVFGPLVLFVNVACVLVLARWGARGKASARAVLDQIIANPLILACAAGLLVNALGWREFGPASDAIDLLAGAALPVALLCVGAGLDLSALRAAGPRVAAACGLKLIVAPFVIWQAALLAGADPISAWIAAGVGATPTAAAGYTLALEMGGDSKLMAGIITASTIACFFTMPLVIALTAPG